MFQSRLHFATSLDNFKPIVIAILMLVDTLLTHAVLTMQCQTLLTYPSMWHLIAFIF